jgi:hypothetical protein
MKFGEAYQRRKPPFCVLVQASVQEIHHRKFFGPTGSVLSLSAAAAILRDDEILESRVYQCANRWYLANNTNCA